MHIYMYMTTSCLQTKKLVNSLLLAHIIHKLSYPEGSGSFKQAQGDARAAITYSEW